MIATRRIVAKCFDLDEDLSEWLAFKGWAVAYIYYSYEYTRAEAWAKSSRRGIWSGEFEMLWDWRRASGWPRLRARLATAGSSGTSARTASATITSQAASSTSGRGSTPRTASAGSTPRPSPKRQAGEGPAN